MNCCWFLKVVFLYLKISYTHNRIPTSETKLIKYTLTGCSTTVHSSLNPVHFLAQVACHSEQFVCRFFSCNILFLLPIMYPVICEICHCYLIILIMIPPLLWVQIFATIQPVLWRFVVRRVFCINILITSHWLLAVAHKNRHKSFNLWLFCGIFESSKNLFV